jgi:hypothetical protein
MSGIFPAARRVRIGRAGGGNGDSVPWFVPAFVHFAMSVGVDEKQDSENQPADDEHED